MEVACGLALKVLSRSLTLDFTLQSFMRTQLLDMMNREAVQALTYHTLWPRVRNWSHNPSCPSAGCDLTFSRTVGVDAGAQ